MPRILYSARTINDSIKLIGTPPYGDYNQQLLNFVLIGGQINNFPYHLEIYQNSQNLWVCEFILIDAYYASSHHVYYRLYVFKVHGFVAINSIIIEKNRIGGHIHRILYLTAVSSDKKRCTNDFFVYVGCCQTYMYMKKYNSVNVFFRHIDVKLRRWFIYPLLDVLIL